MGYRSSARGDCRKFARVVAILENFQGKVAIDVMPRPKSDQGVLIAAIRRFAFIHCWPSNQFKALAFVKQYVTSAQAKTEMLSIRERHFKHIGCVDVAIEDIGYSQILPQFAFSLWRTLTSPLDLTKLGYWFLFPVLWYHNPNSRNAAAISPRTCTNSASIPAISCCTAPMSTASSSSKVST